MEEKKFAILYFEDFSLSPKLRYSGRQVSGLGWILAKRKKAYC